MNGYITIEQAQEMDARRKEQIKGVAKDAKHRIGAHLRPEVENIRNNIQALKDGRISVDEMERAWVIFEEQFLKALI